MTQEFITTRENINTNNSSSQTNTSTLAEKFEEYENLVKIKQLESKMMEANALIAKSDQLGTSPRTFDIRARLFKLAQGVINSSDIVSIRNDIPEPTQFHVVNLIGIPIDPIHINKKLSEVVETEEFISELENIEFGRDEEYENLIKTYYDDSAMEHILKDEAVKTQFTNIENERELIWDIRYDFLKNSVFWRAYLEGMEEFYTEPYFTEIIRDLDTLLVEYNCHNPKIFLQLEERWYAKLRSVQILVSKVIRYVSTKDFKNRILQAKKAKFDSQNQQESEEKTEGSSNIIPSAEKPTTLITPPPPTTSIPPNLSPSSNTISGTAIAINRLKAKNSSANRRGTEELNLLYKEKFERIMNLFPLKKTNSIKINDMKVLSTESQNTPSNQIHSAISDEENLLDIDDIYRPEDTCKIYLKLFGDLIQKGLDTVNRIKLLAKSINFNIYTNKFGDFTPLKSNFSELEQCRIGVISKYGMNLAKKFYQPKIFLKTRFLIMNFPGDLGTGKPVGVKSISPGATTETRIKTSMNTKDSKSQSQNAVESNSMSAMNSLKDEIENEKQSKNIDDTTHQGTTTLKNGYSMGGGVTLGPINVAGAYEDTSTTNDTDKTTTTHEETAKIISKAMDETVNTTNSNKEFTVMDSTENVTEEMKEDTQVITIRNPFQYASLNLFYFTILQEYHSVMIIEDVRIMVTGMQTREYPISELKYFLENEITDEVARERVRTFIKASTILPDYKRRPIQYLEEIPTGYHLRQESYFDLLDEYFEKINQETESGNKHQMDLDDEYLSRYARHLRGLIIDVKSRSVKQNGLMEIALVGKTTMDEAERIRFDARQEAAQMQNVAEGQKISTMEDFREFIKGIQKVDEVTKLKVDAYKILTKELKELFDLAVLETSLDKSGNSLNNLRIKPQ